MMRDSKRAQRAETLRRREVRRVKASTYALSTRAVTR